MSLCLFELGHFKSVHQMFNLFIFDLTSNSETPSNSPDKRKCNYIHAMVRVSNIKIADEVLLLRLIDVTIFFFCFNI